MTSSDRFERRLHLGLDDLAEPLFADYLDDVLAVTGRRRQRPAWTFPGRWIPMVDIARRPAYSPALPWRAITLLIALLLILAIGLLAIGSQRRVPAPFGPARNGLIAYASNGELYVGDPDGASRLIVSGPDEDLEPAFSRSGTLLWFLRKEGNSFRFWTIRPDGSGLTRVNPDLITGPSFTDWGPTDETLYYVSLETGVPRLHVANTDGSGVRVVAPDLAIGAFWLRPPDGREMVVRGEDASGVGLYVMNVDGTNRRTLVAPDGTPPEEHDMGEPRYSPDGTRVAYQHWDGATGKMLMHVINADGTNDTVIPPGAASFIGWPVWTQDSKQLIVQRAFPTASEFLGFEHPFAIVNADGTGEAQEIGPPVAGQHAELSPDGTKLLMFRGDGSQTQVIIDVADGSWEEVPWDSSSYPSWQRLAP